MDSLTNQDYVNISNLNLSFTLKKRTVCKDPPVGFTNTSKEGTEFVWDFGDGDTSMLSPRFTPISAPVHSL